MSKSTAVAKAKVALPVDINKQMAEEVARIQERISAPSGDRITVTQSKTFKLPNGSEVEEFEGVVVEFVSANYYYPDAFDRNNVTPPACFSISLDTGGMTPSPNSPDAQGAACASCWANQFGSAGKGKACQNTRLLALLPTDADAETPLNVLKVSPTAIRAYDSYVSAVARKHNLPVRVVVTKFSFSQDSEYATVRFTEMGVADKELVLLANSRLEEAKQRLLTEPNVTQAEEAAKPAKTARTKPAARQPARAAAR